MGRSLIAISGCCAASLEGLSASGSQTCVRPATPWSSLCPGRIQLTTEKLLKWCQFSQPNKLTFVLTRLTHGHFSPSLLSRGKSAFLPYSDACWVLQHILGNALVSFAGKTGFFCPHPGSIQIHVKLEMKLVRDHSPQNLWLCGICLCHQASTRISDKAGVAVPVAVSCAPVHQQQSTCLAALNPDCPLSFLTSGAVFCPLALENRLLEGPTQDRKPCQTPPSSKEEISSGFQCPQDASEKGQQQHISTRKLGSLAQLNGGNFSSRFYLCIYLTLIKFSCSFLPLLSAWPPPGQAPALP